MLDINKLYTNNICEMASVYGIEAAYCAIKKVSTLCQEAIYRENLLSNICHI